MPDGVAKATYPAYS
ncbi:hypothetical protein SS209_02124 [Salmonella enterica subsp. enterica serovar Senftenberg str. SS209]|nr:hypothetical protein SS209_02124 [Salmonella enterica subsp. enterica serovar Senftenberg str. SS209]